MGNNPETDNDPTGQAYIPPGGGGNGGSGNGNNNNGNGNNGGGGCGGWNGWCVFGGGNSGSGNSSLKVLADSLPEGVGGEASQIQGPEGLNGDLAGQIAEVDAQLTEEGELLTLETEVPQLVDNPGDALQAAETSEQDVTLLKVGDVHEEVAHDVKEYGDSKPVTTDTTTTDTTNTTDTHLSPGADEHIFRGNVNNRGRATGYHWEGDPTAPGQVVSGTETPPDAQGVYEARVEINGIRKYGISSFFPETMSQQDVLDTIEEAYNNRMWVERNTYIGQTSTGMVVQMFLDATTGLINSAFPWYEPGMP